MHILAIPHLYLCLIRSTTYWYACFPIYIISQCCSCGPRNSDALSAYVCRSVVSKRKADDDCVEAAAGDGGLVAKIIEFVKAELAGNDASHDFRHIERVHALARTIAAEEGVAQDVVEIGALLHDVQVGLASFAAELHSHRPATPASSHQCVALRAGPHAGTRTGLEVQRKRARWCGGRRGVLDGAELRRREAGDGEENHQGGRCDRTGSIILHHRTLTTCTASA